LREGERDEIERGGIIMTGREREGIDMARN